LSRLQQFNYKCGTHHWRYPTKEEMGIQRAYGCGSKKSFPSKETAEQALALLNQTQYQCWCGEAAPLTDLELEVYECSTLKKDWHIAPKSYPAEAHKTWTKETQEIVHANWGAMQPWEIARQVNRYLWFRASKGKAHHHACVTTFTGGGVIYQAHALGLIHSEEDPKQLSEANGKEARRILNRECEHGVRLRKCVLCYFGEQSL
jgi:hypothetical protein